MIKSNIGKYITYYRKLSGLTQKELAEKLGVSNRTISSWETDRTEPTAGDVEMMARIFGCNKSDIIRNYMVITDSEIKLIEAFRNADQSTKDVVLRLLQ